MMQFFPFLEQACAPLFPLRVQFKMRVLFDLSSIAAILLLLLLDIDGEHMTEKGAKIDHPTPFSASQLIMIHLGALLDIIWCNYAALHSRTFIVLCLLIRPI